MNIFWKFKHIWAWSGGWGRGSGPTWLPPCTLSGVHEMGMAEGPFLHQLGIAQVSPCTLPNKQKWVGLGTFALMHPSCTLPNTPIVFCSIPLPALRKGMHCSKHEKVFWLGCYLYQCTLKQILCENDLPICRSSWHHKRHKDRIARLCESFLSIQRTYICSAELCLSNILEKIPSF